MDQDRRLEADRDHIIGPVLKYSDLPAKNYSEFLNQLRFGPERTSPWIPDLLTCWVSEKQKVSEYYKIHA